MITFNDKILRCMRASILHTAVSLTSATDAYLALPTPHGDDMPAMRDDAFRFALQAAMENILHVDDTDLRSLGDDELDDLMDRTLDMAGAMLAVTGLRRYRPEEDGEWDGPAARGASDALRASLLRTSVSLLLDAEAYMEALRRNGRECSTPITDGVRDGTLRGMAVEAARETLRHANGDPDPSYGDAEELVAMMGAPGRDD